MQTYDRKKITTVRKKHPAKKVAPKNNLQNNSHKKPETKNNLQNKTHQKTNNIWVDKHQTNPVY